MEIVVYSQYYRTRTADRQLEIDECLRRNLHAPPVPSGTVPVEVIKSDERITYAEWIRRYNPGRAGFHLNDFPHWTPEVRGLRADAEIPESPLYASSFPLGFTGCDNRIVYVLWIHLYGGVTYVHPSLAPDEDSELEFTLWRRSRQRPPGVWTSQQAIEQGIHKLRLSEAEVAQWFLDQQQLKRRRTAPYQRINPQVSVHSRTSILSVSLLPIPKRVASSTIAIRLTKTASADHHSRRVYSQAISIKAQGDSPVKFSRQKRMTFWCITQLAGPFGTKKLNPSIKIAMSKLKQKIITIIIAHRINNLKSFLSCEQLVQLFLGNFSSQVVFCHD